MAHFIDWDVKLHFKMYEHFFFFSSELEYIWPKSILFFDIILC